MKVTPYCIQIGMKLWCREAAPQRQITKLAAIMSWNIKRERWNVERQLQLLMILLRPTEKFVETFAGFAG
jgi:hypothetical protein